MLKTIGTKWKRRPFPTNLQALKQCRISYSQYGEDLFLTHLLGYERTSGTYVDVGCFHPITFSNTYIFYQRGWKGYCIDANPDWRDAWNRYRPRDKFLNAAVAPQHASMWYVRDKLHPAMNRLVDDYATDVPPDCDERFSRSEVHASPLTEILRAAGTPKEIDLLSIDCEGMDLAILQTLDLTEFQPRVLCVEDHHQIAPSPTQIFLTGNGYRIIATIGISKIFGLVEGR